MNFLFVKSININRFSQKSIQFYNMEKIESYSTTFKVIPILLSIQIIMKSGEICRQKITKNLYGIKWQKIKVNQFLDIYIVDI